MFEWSELTLSKVVYFQVVILAFVILAEQVIAQLPWNYFFLLFHLLDFFDYVGYSCSDALYRVFLAWLCVLDV